MIQEVNELSRAFLRGEKSVGKDRQYSNQKKNKVQGIYRKIKQQNSEAQNENKIAAAIISICLFILLLLYVLNAIFDL